MPDERAKGIDVSWWQQDRIDWKKAKEESGISFAYIRASRGLQLDRLFAIYALRAREADILIGFYHYLYPESPDLQARVAAFTDIFVPALPPVLDIEHEGLDEEIVRTYLATFSSLTNRKPIIYTSRSKWHALIGEGQAWAKEYDLWVAHYTNRPEPSLPTPWDTWRFWQFTDGGQIEGYHGPIDLDYFKGTIEELRHWIGCTLYATK